VRKEGEGSEGRAKGARESVEDIVVEFVDINIKWSEECSVHGLGRVRENVVREEKMGECVNIMDVGEVRVKLDALECGVFTNGVDKVSKIGIASISDGGSEL